MSGRGFRGAGRAAIGIAISIVCIWLALRGVNLNETAALLGSAQPAWLVLSLLAFTADLSFRALRWQRLIAPIHRLPYPRLAAYMLVGYLANNFLPARLGEVVRSHYLGDREGISRSATFGTVVVERVIDTVVLVAIGAGAILVLHVRGVVASAVLVGLALAALLCVALVVALAAHRLPGAGRAAAYLARWPRVVGVAARLRDGLRVAAMPKTVAVAVILSVVAWGCTLVGVAAAAQALGIQLKLSEAALFAAGTNLATAIPSGPGYIGTFEYAGQSIALAFGLAGWQGLALALLTHVATLGLSSIGGAAALIRLGWSRDPGAARQPANGAASGPAAPPRASIPRREAADEATFGPAATGGPTGQPEAAERSASPTRETAP